VVVGPSGSGKTSIGGVIFGEPAPFWTPEWPNVRPIVDAIAPAGSFDDVTAALGSVGLGTVPTWLRRYPVLSNGEKFRADLARFVVEAPERAIVDEFTSVVDRQIANFGALAFAKAWRRTKGNRVVLLTPHYDVALRPALPGRPRRRGDQGERQWCRFPGHFSSTFTMASGGGKLELLQLCVYFLPLFLASSAALTAARSTGA